jgi:hypothetical protein
MVSVPCMTLRSVSSPCLPRLRSLLEYVFSSPADRTGPTDVRLCIASAASDQRACGQERRCPRLHPRRPVGRKAGCTGTRGSYPTCRSSRQGATHTSGQGSSVPRRPSLARLPPGAIAGFGGATYTDFSSRAVATERVPLPEHDRPAQPDLEHAHGERLEHGGLVVGAGTLHLVVVADGGGIAVADPGAARLPVVPDDHVAAHPAPAVPLRLPESPRLPRRALEFTGRPTPGHGPTSG